MRTAEQIAERARGKYNPDYITQTNSVAVPIIERLSSEEQLHFVFFNENKGFRIFEPDGEERTPDHPSMTEATGKRFLLLTDKRILYIVGEAKEAEDKVQEFGYDQITSAEGDNAMGKSPKIWFTTTDGRRYKFVNDALGSDTVQNGAEYIRSKIDTSKHSSDKSAQEKTASSGSDQADPATTSSSSQIKYCPDCGTEVNPGATFCSECGTSIDSEIKNQTKNSGKSSSIGDRAESSTNDDGWQSQYSTTVWVVSALVGLLTIPVGLLVPGYFYYKASNGTGANQTPLEVWTILLTGIVGIAVVEFAGRKGAKIIWYLLGGIVLLFILVAMGLA